MRRGNIVIVGTLVVTAVVVIVVVEAMAGLGGVTAVVLGVLAAVLTPFLSSWGAEDSQNRKASWDEGKRDPRTTYYYDDGSSSDDPAPGSDASKDIDR